MSSSGTPSVSAKAAAPTRVVDVVEARQRDPDADRTFRRVQRERRAVEPIELDLPRDDVERGPCVAAVRALVVAEVPDVGGRVVVGVPAAEAVLRVGRVLQRGAGLARIVETEHPRVAMITRQVADLRIVSVQDELRVRLGCDRSAPARGDALELAVAVELVTKEVAEQQRLGPDTACDLGQGAFVDLEEAELGVAGAEEGGGDPGHEVRAGVVVRDAQPRSQDLGDHRGCRCLSVGRRDEHRALWQTAGEAIDRAGVELPEQLAGQRRAAAAAG